MQNGYSCMPRMSVCLKRDRQYQHAWQETGWWEIWIMITTLTKTGQSGISTAGIATDPMILQGSNNDFYLLSASKIRYEGSACLGSGKCVVRPGKISKKTGSQDAGYQA